MTCIPFLDKKLQLTLAYLVNKKGKSKSRDKVIDAIF